MFATKSVVDILRTYCDEDTRAAELTAALSEAVGHPVELANPNDLLSGFSQSVYEVSLFPWDNSTLIVNADNESDALDYAADYAEEEGYEGAFIDTDELDEDAEVIYAGNHSRAIPSESVTIRHLVTLPRR